LSFSKKSKRRAAAFGEKIQELRAPYFDVPDIALVDQQVFFPVVHSSPVRCCSPSYLKLKPESGLLPKESGDRGLGRGKVLRFQGAWNAGSLLFDGLRGSFGEEGGGIVCQSREVKKCEKGSLSASKVGGRIFFGYFGPMLF
jgi:hypothetical protein